jgi:hypothetical protein
MAHPRCVLTAMMLAVREGLQQEDAGRCFKRALRPARQGNHLVEIGGLQRRDQLTVSLPLDASSSSMESTSFIPATSGVSPRASVVSLFRAIDMWFRRARISASSSSVGFS